MAGLISDLTSSAMALDAQQTGLQVTSNNLANVNNSSYATQSLQLANSGVMETSLGEMSMGVTAVGVSQARNPFLDAQVSSEISQTSSLQEMVTQLTTAQSYLGEQVASSTTTSSITDNSSGTSGVSTALNNFFNSFSSLASSPSDAGAQQTVIQSATTLADTINTAYSQLTNLQSGLGTQISQGVTTVNGLLSNVAKLNGQIQEYETSNPNSTPNDLLDQRQADVEQISQYMNVSVSNVAGTNGQIQVSTLDSSSNPVTLVSKTSVEGNVAFNGTSFTAGTPTSTLGLTGGSMQGDLAASSGPIQTLINNLSSTSAQLTTAVNSAYNPGGTGTNFFQGTPAAGSLLTLDSSLSSGTVNTTNTGTAGGNELALAVAQVQSQTFSTSGGDAINGTLGGSYSSAVTSLGESIDSAQTQLTDQTAVQTMVETQRSSVSGVNQDDELTQLMTYQSAFQAQARVMNTVNDMLDIVCNGLFGASVS